MWIYLLDHIWSKICSICSRVEIEDVRVTMPSHPSYPHSLTHLVLPHTDQSTSSPSPTPSYGFTRVYYTARNDGNRRSEGGSWPKKNRTRSARPPWRVREKAFECVELRGFA